MWRAIWNGPFFIGPLTRPVSVGDVMMKVLETAWRAAVLIVGAVGAFVAWSSIQSSLNERARNAAKLKTDVIANYDREACPASAPIRVLIGNRSNRTLSWVSYEVQVLDRPGGRNVAPARLMNLSVSDPIAPGKGLAFCHSLVDTYGDQLQLRPEMVIVGKLNYVTLQ
jgi:hypothetical protein